MGSTSFSDRQAAPVVAALDFGTTYSGCAVAHSSDPTKVHTLYKWPFCQGTYSKTNTELYYIWDDRKELSLKSWGGAALMNFNQAPMTAGELIKNFKLHLAGSQYGPSTAQPLPGTLTTAVVITDYLREISKHIMKLLRETYGRQFGMRDVQWCLTVPAIWDDHAKQLMKSYAEDAGLVQSTNFTEGSPYPLLIVLEPEAAAVFCLTSFEHLTYAKGDKFMTADLGGGTVDLVIHEKIWNSSKDRSNLEMREVAKSSGGLCGSTFVDMEFIHHLERRIPCFRSFIDENPSTLVHILKWWETIKINFNGDDSQMWPLPAVLAEAWKLDDQSEGRPTRGTYGQIEFTLADLIHIFEPVVKKVIELIEEALRPFAPKEVKTIMAVGGFSGNAYLINRLKETFIPRLVEEILTPHNPGGAICNGAVKLGMKDCITSRVVRKTYGISILRLWEENDPIKLKCYNDDEDLMYCKNAFDIFVQKGEAVPSNHSITRSIFPVNHNTRNLTIAIYSSDESTKPKYTTDAGVVMEGEFQLDISSDMRLDKDRETAVTMYFGRSSIEVTAKGVNFKASGGVDKPIFVAFRASGGVDKPSPVAFKGGRSFRNAATDTEESDISDRVANIIGRRRTESMLREREY